MIQEVASFPEEWEECVKQLRIRHLVERGKGCCWPMWADGARPNFMFCGAAKDGPLSSYCAEHAQLAHVPPLRASQPVTRPGPMTPRRSVTETGDVSPKLAVRADPVRTASLSEAS